MDDRFRRNLVYSVGLHIGLLLVVLVGTVLAGRLPRQETSYLIQIDFYNPDGTSGPDGGGAPPPEPEEAPVPEPEEEDEVVQPPKEPQPERKPEPKPEPTLTRKERIEQIRSQATPVKEEPRRPPRQVGTLADDINARIDRGTRLGPRTGTSTGRGAGGSSHYGALITELLRERWKRPFRVATVAVKPVMAFTVEADGRVTGVRAVVLSGDVALDQSVQAIFTSQLRVPPLPRELGPRFELEVSFVPDE